MAGSIVTLGKVKTVPYKIKESGGKWSVVSESGTTIGRHVNKRDAIQQKIAVEMQEGIGQKR
jgi:hypothetical protein